MMEPMLNQLNGWTVAVYAWGIVVTIIGFFAVRIIKRVDDLEKRGATKADILEVKQDIKALRDDFREDLKEHRDESKESIQHVVDRLEGIYELILRGIK